MIFERDVSARFGYLICLLAITCLTACSNVLDTSSFDKGDVKLSDGATCHFSAGSYYLPRQLLTIQVETTDPAGASPVEYTVNVKADRFVADTSRLYCLDYLSSIFSSDQIVIRRTPDNLLSEVGTQLSDKSAEIANEAIAAAGNAIASAIGSGRSAVGVDLNKDDATKSKYILASYEADLFDAPQMLRIDRALGH